MSTKIYYRSKFTLFYLLGILMIVPLPLLFIASFWWEYALAISGIIFIIMLICLYFFKLEKIELQEEYFIYYDNRFKEPKKKWKWVEITHIIEVNSVQKKYFIVNNNDQKNSVRLFRYYWGKDLIKEIQQRSRNAKITNGD